MGCGGSKFDEAGKAVPARVRPLLRRRIDEIKQRRLYSIHNALKNSTPSKKNLLHTNEHDNEDSHTCQEDQEDDHQHFVEHHDKEEEDSDIPDQPAPVETVNLFGVEDLGLKSVADSDSDSEYAIISSHDEAFICPGSPSFRVYCVESLDINNDDDHQEHHDHNHDDCEDGMCAIKTSSQGDDHSNESVNSTEGSVGKTRKKGHNAAGRKIRRVIHKGRHVAKKNLMSVKSCYNPASAGHDNAHLLQKAQS